MTDNLEHFFSDALHFTMKCSTHLRMSGIECRFGIRLEDVHQGFCLGEVHFIVQKGAPGKFPRFSKSSPGSQSRFQNPPLVEIATMTVNFNHILPRKAPGTLHPDEESGIEKSSIQTRAEGTVVQLSRLPSGGLGREEAFSDSKGIRTTEPNDSHSSPGSHGGYCCNRVHESSSRKSIRKNPLTSFDFAIITRVKGTVDRTTHTKVASYHGKKE